MESDQSELPVWDEALDGFSDSCTGDTRTTVPPVAFVRFSESINIVETI